MKEVIYYKIISIDGRDHTISCCDYSESINELIKDNILEDNDSEIVDHIFQEECT